jgi:hypothetical protein
MEKRMLIGIIAIIFTYGLPRMGNANPITITFDETTGEIGNYYQSMGVNLFRGNSEYGTSDKIVGSAWAYEYVDAAVSDPNVLVPLPGHNNDIITYFYDKSLNRTSASYIKVQNDIENHPNHIILAAFDKYNNIIQTIDIYGSGGSGSIKVDNIWYAMIYSAPQSAGLLGVDNFAFRISSVQEPASILLFSTAVVGLAGVERRRKRQ